MYTDKITVFDFESIQSVNKDCIIQDFDDYIIVDNFLENIDKFCQELLKYPVDNGEKLFSELYASGKREWDFPKQPGHSQVIPVQLLERYIFNIYKILVDCEYLPQRANDNLLNPMFATSLSRSSVLCGNIFHENMIINENANAPTPAIGEYYALLFMDDEEEGRNGVSLYDFVYEGKSYSCIDDIKNETNDVVSEISDFLNVKHSVKKQLLKYTPFQDNNYFITKRYIPAKKNRLFITRGGNWINQIYSKNAECYRVSLSFIEPKL